MEESPSRDEGISSARAMPLLLTRSIASTGTSLMMSTSPASSADSREENSGM